MLPASATELPASLEQLALSAVRAAALAAYKHAGSGDGKAADGAATEAMRHVLGETQGLGTVIIGEGEKDNAPMLFNGEELGDGDGPRFDIAVDPVECTDLCANGLPGSLTTIAFAGDGCLWSPGPGHYQDKLVVGRARARRDRPARELGVERQERRRRARQARRRDARAAARQAAPRRARRSGCARWASP